MPSITLNNALDQFIVVLQNMQLISETNPETQHVFMAENDAYRNRLRQILYELENHYRNVRDSVAVARSTQLALEANPEVEDIDVMDDDQLQPSVQQTTAQAIEEAGALYRHGMNSLAQVAQQFRGITETVPMKNEPYVNNDDDDDDDIGGVRLARVPLGRIQVEGESAWLDATAWNESLNVNPRRITTIGYE